MTLSIFIVLSLFLPASLRASASCGAAGLAGLYGTTSNGGSSNQGTLFRLDPATGELTTLLSFNGANGAEPSSTLIVLDGLLYGTTAGGGNHDLGTVYSFDPASQVLTTLVSFDGTNGAKPRGALVSSGALLYGTASSGGPFGGGTLFSLEPVTRTLTTLAAFTYSNTYGPWGPLLASDGVIYGTTYFEGPYGYGDGTVFAFDTVHASLTTLAAFYGSNGVRPVLGTIVDGQLYGTTIGGGPVNPNAGTVFRLDPGTSNLTTLATFVGSNGAGPQSGVIGSGGMLFGTTVWGGASNEGTLFSLDPVTSRLTTLVSFGGSNGANPVGGLAMSGGKLYGTLVGMYTSQGGGGLYSFDVATNTLITLVSFDYANGANPMTGLVTFGTVDREPPVVVAPAGLTVSTSLDTTSCGVVVTDAQLGAATATDDCGVAAIVRTGVPAGNFFPVGRTTVTYTATDFNGNQASAAQTVTVIDQTPPVIAAVSANPSVLWPVNHKMVTVTVDFQPTDNCSIAATWLEVLCNQPVNGNGDGNTSPDWYVVDSHHVQLRAERSGTANDRIYTLRVHTKDVAGNETMRDVFVTVPHDQSN